MDAPTLQAEIARRREALIAMGLRRGDRVVLMHGNTPHAFADLMAVWDAGACPIPVDPCAAPAELERLVRHAAPRLTIRRDGACSGLTAATAGVRLVDSRELDSYRPRRRGRRSSLEMDDPALILYTSGVTGRPKAVLHTFRSLFFRLRRLKKHLGTADFKRTLCLLPTHFAHGLISNSLYPLLNGCELILLPPFSLPILMETGGIIDEYRVTFMSSVPTVWNMALRMAPAPRRGTLRRVHSASAPLSAASWKGIKDWTRARTVKNVYGMTETRSWSAGTDDGAAPPVDGHVGRGWGARIAVRARADGPGEVWVKTGSLMRGYYRQAALTRAVVRDGWYRTGDVGYLHADGGLVLLGRTDDVINRSGLKIHPAEVEAALAEHPGISEACVFGLPDPVGGEVVCAALVPFRAAQAPSPLELASWCRHHLAPSKIPTQWFTPASLPKTSSGKFRRKDVAALCAGLSRHESQKAS